MRQIKLTKIQGGDQRLTLLVDPAGWTFTGNDANGTTWGTGPNKEPVTFAESIEQIEALLKQQTRTEEFIREAMLTLVKVNETLQAIVEHLEDQTVYSLPPVPTVEPIPVVEPVRHLHATFNTKESPAVTEVSETQENQP